MAQGTFPVDGLSSVGSEGRETWAKIYAAEKDAWSVPIINKAVSAELYEKFIGGRENLQIFLPMCGRSPDMIWLASQGHNVTGVEWVGSAVEKFFKENNLEYEVKTDVNVGQGKGALYSAKTAAIKIYCCDFFLVTAEVINKFDLILDVGSVSGVEKTSRDAYGIIIRNLLKPKGGILLSTFNFDQNLRKILPFAIAPEEIQTMFGNDFEITAAQTDGSEKFRKFYAVEHIFDVMKLPTFEWNIHLLTAKI